MQNKKIATGNYFRYAYFPTEYSTIYILFNKSMKSHKKNEGIEQTNT